MFRKFGSMTTLDVADAYDGAAMRKFAHRAVFEFVPEAGYVYVRSRAISSRVNDNFDGFEAKEIATEEPGLGWRTFLGKPVFVNHANTDHRVSRGLIIDAVLHEDVNPDGSDDTWIEVLHKVDGQTFPLLAKAIIKGRIDRTSMGTDVGLSICSVCNNKATNPSQYCEHLPGKKGKKLLTPDGPKLCYEICRKLSFFENSLLVEPPADPTAHFLGDVVVGPGLEHLSTAASLQTTAAVANSNSKRNLAMAGSSRMPLWTPGQFVQAPDGTIRKVTR